MTKPSAAGVPHSVLSVENPGEVREGHGLFALQSWSAMCTAATERIFRKIAFLQIL